MCRVAYLLAFWVCSIASAQQVLRLWKASDVPNPALDPLRARRLGKGLEGSHLSDPDGVLSLRDAERIEILLDRLHASILTPCNGNYEPIEVGVAIINNMDSPLLHHDASSAAKQFATKVQTNWGVGHSLCSNGALLFLSMNDRAFSLAVGEGLEKLLPQKSRNLVLDVMKPHLRAGRVGEAIESALLLLLKLLSKQPSVMLAGAANLADLGIDERRGAGGGAGSFGGGDGGAKSRASRYEKLLKRGAVGSGLFWLGRNAYRRHQIKRTLARFEQLARIDLHPDGVEGLYVPDLCPICRTKRGDLTLQCSQGHTYCSSCLDHFLSAAGLPSDGSLSACPICDRSAWDTYTTGNSGGHVGWGNAGSSGSSSSGFAIRFAPDVNRSWYRRKKTVTHLQQSPVRPLPTAITSTNETTDKPISQQSGWVKKPVKSSWFTQTSTTTKTTTTVRRDSSRRERNFGGGSSSAASGSTW